MKNDHNFLLHHNIWNDKNTEYDFTFPQYKPMRQMVVDELITDLQGSNGLTRADASICTPHAPLFRVKAGHFYELPVLAYFTSK